MHIRKSTQKKLAEHAQRVNKEAQWVLNRPSGEKALNRILRAYNRSQNKNT